MDKTRTKRLAHKAIRLHDELGWRLRLLNMGLLHVTSCKDAPMDEHEAMSALGTGPGDDDHLRAKGGSTRGRVFDARGTERDGVTR